MNFKSSDFESAHKQTGMHLGICINTENFLLGLLHDLYVLHKLIMKVSESTVDKLLHSVRFIYGANVYGGEGS